MKTLKTVIVTLVAIAVLVPLAVLAVIYSGVYNVAATSEHWPVTYWLLSETVHRSIAEHAENIEVPPLSAHEQILAGAANYEDMCAGCHAAPGRGQGLPGVAMYPQPPRLDEIAKAMTPAQVFWVIKHGIKASGMPAWGPSHGAEEIWSLVAFVQQLPRMSAAEYTQLQRAAKAGGMGHHGHSGSAHGAGRAHSDTEAPDGLPAHGRSHAHGHAHAESDAQVAPETGAAHAH